MPATSACKSYWSFKFCTSDSSSLDLGPGYLGPPSQLGPIGRSSSASLGWWPGRCRIASSAVHSPAVMHPAFAANPRPSGGNPRPPYWRWQPAVRVRPQDAAPKLFLQLSNLLLGYYIQVCRRLKSRNAHNAKYECGGSQKPTDGVTGRLAQISRLLLLLGEKALGPGYLPGNPIPLFHRLLQ